MGRPATPDDVDRIWGERDVSGLREIITDARATPAPQQLVTEHLGSLDG